MTINTFALYPNTDGKTAIIFIICEMMCKKVLYISLFISNNFFECWLNLLILLLPVKFCYAPFSFGNV